jgi:hypothetical protein
LGANVIFPLLSALVSVIFAAMVFDQWRRRGKPFQLVWTVGLLWYAASTGAEFLGYAGGWTAGLYRLWYVAGAFFVAAYLGMGTVYLLAPRRLAHAVMLVLAVASVFAAFRVAGAVVDLALLPAAGEAVSGRALPADVRVLTPFFNVFGATALIGGAGYSAWVFWRRKAMPRRVVSNALIAAGAFFPSLTGALSRFGLADLLPVGEFLGVMIIFAGVLASSEVFERRLPFARQTQG